MMKKWETLVYASHSGLSGKFSLSLFIIIIFKRLPCGFLSFFSTPEKKKEDDEENMMGN